MSTAEHDTVAVRPTGRQIMARVADERGVTIADLTGSSRDQKITFARFAAIRAVRAETKLSTTQIGRLFNRDHTTVCHALGVLKKRKPSDLAKAAAGAAA